MNTHTKVDDRQLPNNYYRQNGRKATLTHRKTKVAIIFFHYHKTRWGGQTPRMNTHTKIDERQLSNNYYRQNGER